MMRGKTGRPGLLFCYYDFQVSHSNYYATITLILNSTTFSTLAPDLNNLILLKKLCRTNLRQIIDISHHNKTQRFMGRKKKPAYRGGLYMKINLYLIKRFSNGDEKDNIVINTLILISYTEVHIKILNIKCEVCTYIATTWG